MQSVEHCCIGVLFAVHARKYTGFPCICLCVFVCAAMFALCVIFFKKVFVPFSTVIARQFFLAHFDVSIAINLKTNCKYVDNFLPSREINQNVFVENKS